MHVLNKAPRGRNLNKCAWTHSRIDSTSIAPQSRWHSSFQAGKDVLGKYYTAEDIEKQNLIQKHYVATDSRFPPGVGPLYARQREIPVANQSQVHAYTHYFDIGQGYLAIVEIGNPLKANCLSSRTLNGVREIFETLAKDEKLRAVILTGCKVAGPAQIFSAGADIKEMEALSSSDEAQTFIKSVYHAAEAVRKCPVPTIARIDGLCFGAALEIAACCDFRYAISGSLFSMKEVALGIPSVVQARMLANIVGWQATKRMVLLGKDYKAGRMFELGLLDGCYQTVAYMDAVIESAVTTIAGNGPKATRAQKTLNRYWEEGHLQPGILQGIEVFGQMWEDGGTEPKKYMGAWMERRRRQKGKRPGEEPSPESSPGLNMEMQGLLRPEGSKRSPWDFLKLR